MLLFTNNILTIGCLWFLSLLIPKCASHQLAPLVPTQSFVGEQPGCEGDRQGHMNDICLYLAHVCIFDGFKLQMTGHNSPWCGRVCIRLTEGRQCVPSSNLCPAMVDKSWFHRKKTEDPTKYLLISASGRKSRFKKVLKSLHNWKGSKPYKESHF